MKIDPDKAVPEIVRLAATAGVLWFLLSHMNIATKDDVAGAKHDIERGAYRLNLVAITYQQREGVTLFGWTIDDDFAGPMPTTPEE